MSTVLFDMDMCILMNKTMGDKSGSMGAGGGLTLVIRNKMSILESEGKKMQKMKHWNQRGE